MTNKTLIITEKLDQASWIISALRNHITESEVDVLDFRSMGFFNFDIPSDLPISEAPFIQPTKWHYRNLKDFPHFLKHPDASHYVYKLSVPSKESVSLSKRKNLFNIPNMTPLPEQLKIITDRIDNYDEIIIAPCYSHRGVYFCSQLIEEMLKVKPELVNRTKMIHITDLDEKFIIESFSCAKLYSGKEHPLYKVAEIKYYFDWLWLINSASVFGKALKIAGAKTDHIISKYELLTFLLIAKKKLPKVKTDSKCERTKVSFGISMYKGSGKHEMDRFFGWAGSPSSKYQILENLIKIGLLNKDAQITLEGERFHDLVHKRSFDPDISYRLEQWVTSGDVEAMEKYIKTLFQRQKNFNSVTGLSTHN